MENSDPKVVFEENKRLFAANLGNLGLEQQLLYKEYITVLTRTRRRQRLAYCLSTGPEICILYRKATKAEVRQGFNCQIKVADNETLRVPKDRYIPVSLVENNYYVSSDGGNEIKPGQWFYLEAKEED